MKQPYKFFPRYSKGQQKGVLSLFVLIILVQAGYYVFNYTSWGTEASLKEQQEWLKLQGELDRLKIEKSVNRDTVYPFNPNYLSSYKGYMLGMSVAELQRLDNYRAGGNFLENTLEFQKVTRISDSLLATIKPYLRFPANINFRKEKGYNLANAPAAKAKNTIPVIDINHATEEDLIKVYGIGPYFSKAIINRRIRLGAYVSMDQMFDFENIPPETVERINKAFAVVDIPKPFAVNVNSASLNQLSHFPYFNKELARAILTRRSMLGKFSKIEDLLEINGFPIEKEKIIALYLEF